jgi:hypothetical protein
VADERVPDSAIEERPDGLVVRPVPPQPRQPQPITPQSTDLAGRRVVRQDFLTYVRDLVVFDGPMPGRELPGGMRDQAEADTYYVAVGPADAWFAFARSGERPALTWVPIARVWLD